ncbi:MAG: thioredoxin [Acidimicrobiales bacterium]
MDVTDATFQTEVIERSDTLPVVVDLWAPWCGPCRTLGPILEKAVAEREGEVELVKVNIDENPRISATFQIQSIPAVYALRDRQVVDGFVGALPEAQVKEFVARVAPAASEADNLVAVGDEVSLRQALDLESDHPGAIVGLARILIDRGEPGEALQFLSRIPESPESRQLAAEARLAVSDVEVPADGVDVLLDGLLPRVKDDEAARQEFLDLLETLGPDDPRATRYRKELASRLF